MLGLVGSVGAGKSTVAAELARLGARVHSADEHVHELLARSDVAAEIIAALGTETDITDGNGALDRRRLAARVFADRAALQRLEAILHPRTGARIEQVVAETRAAGTKKENGNDNENEKVPVLVIDAPLLLEAGGRDQVDRLLVVDAPRAARRARLAAARGWGPDELETRDARLTPIEQKKRLADWVIENDGSQAELREKVRHVWRSLK